jgi:hypothetical protein
VPYKGVYNQVDNDLSTPGLFDADFVAAFSDLNCTHVYQYSTKLAFVRFVGDSDGDYRFALVGILQSYAPMTIMVSTAEDVDSQFDISKYTGTWNYTYNNTTGSATTYIDILTPTSS